MTGCTEEVEAVVDQIVTYVQDFLKMLGWDPEKEDTDIPADEITDDEGLPPSLDLTLGNAFPPIGDQGEYGTCVAWATGYAMKTYLDKKDKSSLNTSSPSDQTSPVDLWFLIKSSDKGKDCGGTNFDPAFNTMINTGVKSMAAQPFTNNKMTCGSSSSGDNSRTLLKMYRIIAYTNDLKGNGDFGNTVANIKGHLNLNGPVAIGARLGDNFMNCKNSSVLSSETYNYTGQHAYHALVVVGYDDSKGKGAFRIRNSWGTGWGDNGSIWIDYDFFIKSFFFGAWIASNKDLNDISTVSLRSASPNDLQMEILKDYETAGGSRIVEYDIKNTGSATISAGENWSAVYLLFRKNRINERYILFQDYYGNEGAKGSISSYSNGVAINSSGNTLTNIDIVPGSSAAEAMSGKRLAFEYTLPADKDGNKLNGEFYMVLIADAFGNVDEMDKENNFCFLTGRSGEPVKIVDGKITNIPTQLKDLRTLVSESTPNNYSGIEIQQILERQFKKGKLKKTALQESGLRGGKVAKQVK